MKTVCILGLGYIGLPTACMFATHGIKVIGVDTNRRVIQSLNNGDVHIEENGLHDLAKRALNSGNLIVRDAPSIADAFIIAVPTPFNVDKTADMSYVVAAAEAIVPNLCTGNLVILESTSPPCTTTDLIKPILERSGLIAGTDFLLAYSPERVLPGQILKELVENARVIGGINQQSAEAGKELYSSFVKGEIVLTDATTAEMVKLMENTYRDINIAIANEFSRLADRFGIDVWEAVRIANLHPRVKILNPGPGVGGHCISVDPWFLVEAAPDITPLIRTARQVNDAQPHYVVELVKRALGSLEGRRIAVLGLAYKADVDDLRESPALEVAEGLTQHGASVVAFEPNRVNAEFERIKHAKSLAEAVEEADAIAFLVGHRQFRSLRPHAIDKLTKARIIIDAINIIRSDEWEEAGYSIYKL